MDEQQVFIVLPSNSSMNLYPDNKTSSFRVNLTNPLSLDPMKWEVGLAEIQSPQTFYNIRSNKNIIYKSYIHPSIDELNRFFPISPGKDISTETDRRREVLDRKPNGMDITYRRMISVPPGHYDSIESILRILRANEEGDSRPILEESGY